MIKIIVGIHCLFFSIFLKAEDLRRIYLNGVDISSATHQQLENVHIRIDGQGNIFIEAPHYEVSEENTYLPLSSLQSDATRLQHQGMQALPNSLSKVSPTTPLQPLSKELAPVNNSVQENDPSINRNKEGQKNNDDPRATGP